MPKQWEPSLSWIQWHMKKESDMVKQWGDQSGKEDGGLSENSNVIVCHLELKFVFFKK